METCFCKTHSQKATQVPPAPCSPLLHTLEHLASPAITMMGLPNRFPFPLWGSDTCHWMVPSKVARRFEPKGNHTHPSPLWESTQLSPLQRNSFWNHHPFNFQPTCSFTPLKRVRTLEPWNQFLDISWAVFSSQYSANSDPPLWKRQEQFCLGRLRDMNMWEWALSIEWKGRCHRRVPWLTLCTGANGQGQW